MEPMRQVFTIKEAADFLRVPEGWLRKKVTAGLVPHTRLGKHVRFTAAQLSLILANGETPLTEHVLNPSGVSSRARRAS